MEARVVRMLGVRMGRMIAIAILATSATMALRKVALGRRGDSHTVFFSPSCTNCESKASGTAAVLLAGLQQRACNKGPITEGLQQKACNKGLATKGLQQRACRPFVASPLLQALCCKLRRPRFSRRCGAPRW